MWTLEACWVLLLHACARKSVLASPRGQRQRLLQVLQLLHSGCTAVSMLHMHVGAVERKQAVIAYDLGAREGRVRVDAVRWSRRLGT